MPSKKPRSRARPLEEYQRAPAKLVQAQILELLKKAPMTRKQLAEALGYTLIKVTKATQPLLKVEGESNLIYVLENKNCGGGGRPEHVLAYGPGKKHQISKEERVRIAKLVNNTFRSTAKQLSLLPPREIIETPTGLIHINHY